jgi:Putative esterase
LITKPTEYLLSLVVGLACLFLGLFSNGVIAEPLRQVDVKLHAKLHNGPVTGRVFLLITDRSDVEPRSVTSFTYVYYFNQPRKADDFPFDYAPFWGQDVQGLRPGESVILGGGEEGYPYKTLQDLPPGDYFVQALLHLYTQVKPAHGKTIWLPMDQWEGQQFHLSPGNLVSKTQKISVKKGRGFKLKLTLDNRIPLIATPVDTQYVKHIKFKSERASKFWGKSMSVGMHVTLPKGYDEHPDAHYPVVYRMGHFLEQYSINLPTDDKPSKAENLMLKGWLAEDTPRFITVTLFHPTPFYDDSHFVNSDNTGPWHDVLMEELIPYLEKHFRVIDKPYARVMYGGSTGGWISLNTQVKNPDFFGGAWVYCPDPIDFREMFGINLYEDSNAFVEEDFVWQKPERPFSRSVTGRTRMTLRQFSQFSAALGSHSRGGEFVDNYAAMYGPVGDNGYPVPIWDHQTGAINRAVIEQWRDRGFDLRHYLETHWPTLGPKLEGQLQFLCGDMDQFYTNVAMYLMEEFLESTKAPYYGGSFRFGRPKIGHTFDGIGLDPWPWAMFKEMAEHIKQRAPEGEDTRQWNYK